MNKIATNNQPDTVASAIQQAHSEHATNTNALAHETQTQHTQETLHLASVSPDVLFEIYGIPVTNSLLMAFIAVLALSGFAAFFRKKIAMVPGKLQSAIEIFFEGFLDFMEEIFEDKKAARKFFPFIMTILIFVAFVNMLKFLPGVDAFYVHKGGEELHLLRPVATDLNFTLALAIITLVVIEITGIATLGLFKYGKRFINFKSPLAFAVGLIELVSEFVRLIAFSFRLFGNIFAGKILLAVVVFFLPLIVPMPVMLYEMFVGIVQAAIFALLALLFIKLAMQEPH